MYPFEKQCELAALQAQVEACKANISTYDASESSYPEDSYFAEAEAIKFLAGEMRKLGKVEVEENYPITLLPMPTRFLTHSGISSELLIDTVTGKIQSFTNYKDCNAVCKLLNKGESS